MTKIFGIGYPRTGTTSLSEALRILGYKTVQFPHSLKEIEDHDASTDSSVCVAYKFLWQHFPGSKFILCVREMESWLESCRIHFAAPWPGNEKIRFELFGAPSFHEQLFRLHYEEHNRAVRDFFGRRGPDQLLVYAVCNGEGWGPLCQFLDKSVPDVKFPVANTRDTTTSRPDRRHLRKPGEPIYKPSGGWGAPQ
jgi:hypothetical protein